MDIGHLICFSLILGPKKEFQLGVNEDWESERAEVYWSNTCAYSLRWHNWRPRFFTHLSATPLSQVPLLGADGVFPLPSAHLPLLSLFLRGVIQRGNYLARGGGKKDSNVMRMFYEFGPTFGVLRTVSFISINRPAKGTSYYPCW